MSLIEAKIKILRTILERNGVACFSNNVDERFIRPGMSIIPGYKSRCDEARTKLGLPLVEEGLTIYNPPIPNENLFIPLACRECPALASSLTQLERVIASQTMNYGF